MESIAKLRYYRQSPRKVRLVADVIRGQDTNDALNQLQFTGKRAALPIQKLLSSAIANAVNNFSLKRENLYVKKIFVDGGPVLKRWMPRAFGKASEIRKRTSHVTIVLDEKIKTAPREDAVKKEDNAASKIEIKSTEEIKTAKPTGRKTPDDLKRKEDAGRAGKTRRAFAPKLFQRKAG